VITVDDLPPAVTGSSHQAGKVLVGGSEPLPEMVSRMEREMIVQALGKAHGVQTRAAALLGISERVLRYKMGKYRLE
jgi:two-component system response regulator AtoC